MAGIERIVTVLPWNERVSMLYANPDAATPADVVWLAAEAIEANCLAESRLQAGRWAIQELYRLQFQGKDPRYTDNVIWRVKAALTPKAPCTNG